MQLGVGVGAANKCWLSLRYANRKAQRVIPSGLIPVLDEVTTCLKNDLF